MTLKRLKIIFLIFLLVLYGLLVTQEINLVTADLGRHLKNGEVLCQNLWQFLAPPGGVLPILRTNFYSYTYPDYPFILHHWGSGVIFYLIQKAFGFSGLSIFFSAVALATFLVFFRIAWKSSRFGVAVLASVVVIPLLASRVEIRPEVFSYFLAGLFWWILSSKRKWRWCLLFLELIWVNLHIYFFLGLFLIGVFWIESGIDWMVERIRGKNSLKILRKQWDLVDLTFLGIVSSLVCLLNPAGFKGALYPLQIFKGYGYRLFENQTVWFLDKIVRYPPNLYFKITFGILLLSWLYVFIKRKEIYLGNLLFTIGYSFLGWTAVRNFALFGYFAIPIMATNIGGGRKKEESLIEYFIIASVMISLTIILFLLSPSYWQNRISLGVGLKKGNAGAAEFFQKENLHGPIFNNYDNGSYLIYFLFPKEKVFVDNRPEAYPKEFFEKTYVPMQESKDQWEKEDQKYNFNTIFFHRNDLTPWAQQFLLTRITDPSWAPVYVDEWQIIFLKRNKENQGVIQKYELPKKMFSVGS